MTTQDLFRLLAATFGPPTAPPPPYDPLEAAGIPHHDGHDCPTPGCHGGSGWCEAGMPDTYHVHRCPDCGAEWRHGPGGVVNEEAHA